VASTAASATPDGASALPPWGRPWPSGGGPAVARLFHRALALVLLCAWLSLGSQVEVLVGSRGLLPARDFFARARAAGLGFWEEPSVLWWWYSDGALRLGVVAGALLAVLALIGVRPRVCFALSAPLYLSFATVCDEFTAFQWDNMLVETALLAALLPRDRPAPLAHLALRLLLFKLYFESGIAKWLSHLRDWHDGSAMSFYYETAPLPAALGWFMHQLPAWFHRIESWSALLLELAVPLLIWGPRPARLCACAAFTAFQIVNTATANYGYFTYLTLALHVLLLDDGDIARAAAALRLGRLGDGIRVFTFWRPRTGPGRSKRENTNHVPARRHARWVAVAALGAWVAASALAGWLSLARSGPRPRALIELYRVYAPWRVANAYHLFGHITRQRIEPQFETLTEGEWREHDLCYKPGSVQRIPPYVAPHQPRVDFRLWFYGLSFRRGLPRYVDNLLDRLCGDPRAVAALFEGGTLPEAPEAVRVVFYRYRFTTPEQRAQSGAYWTRELVAAAPARSCR
jgi:hypothetical protein